MREKGGENGGTDEGNEAHGQMEQECVGKEGYGGRETGGVWG